MKKFLIIVFVIALLIAGYSYDQFGWCKKLFFGEPTTHVIQKGEYLSKISQKYYGTADYWRELALINRAPDSDVVFPGEEIIIPSLDVVKEIHRTRWLSKVNNYVKNQEDIIARLKMGEEPTFAENIPAETEPMTTPEKMLENDDNLIVPDSEDVYASVENEQQTMNQEQAESASSLGFILAVIGVVFVASLIAIVLIRRKKRSQQIKIVDDDELNILDEDEDSEPDYQEYLKNKSKRKNGVLVD